jgi:hypothetical protein
MTSLNVSTTGIQAENRAWLRGPHGTEPGANPNVTLDISKFAGLYPNGFIPSGTLLAKLTTGGKYGPYDTAATDGTEVAKGFLFGSLTVEPGATVVAGGLLNHGYVNETKLPFQTGKGSVDADAKAALTHIIFD